MVYITPEAGLTLTDERGPGVLDGLWVNNSVPTVLVMDAVFPASPTDGTLYESGGSAVGSWAGVRDGGTIFRARAGSGAALPNAGAAWIDVPVADLPFDGRSHTVALVFSASPAQLQLVIDGWFIATAVPSAGAFTSNLWTGGDVGGFGQVGGAGGPAGEPTGSSWPGSLGTIRLYRDQAVMAIARQPDQWAFLAELEGKDQTFRFANEALSDPNGPGFYPDVMQSSPAYRSTLESGNGQLLGGGARVTRGTLKLHPGRHTNGLLTGKVAGRGFKLLRGPSGGKYWQFGTIFNGICGRPSGFSDRIEVPILGRTARLANSVITDRLAGDNVAGLGVDETPGVLGLEGDESLKGQPVPFLAGRVPNFEGVLVNAVHGVILVCKGPATINTVQVGGIDRVAGPDYATKVDLTTISNPATSGQYRVYTAIDDDDFTYVRLSGRPEGVVHIDAMTGANDAGRTPAQLAASVLTLAGEVAEPASVTALDAAFGHVTGFYSATQDPSFDQVLSSLLADAGAYFEETETGEFRLIQIPVPQAGNAVATFQLVAVDEPAASGTIDLASFRVQVPQNQNAAHPIRSLVVKYARNYRVLSTGELLGDPSLPPIDQVTSPQTSPLNYDPVGGWERRNQLGSRYLATDQVADQVVADDYPLSTDLEVETGLYTEAGAVALRDLQFDRLKVERVFADAQVSALDPLVDPIRRGDVVMVIHPDFGFDQGRPMTVIGIRRIREGEGGGGRLVQFRLWG